MSLTENEIYYIEDNEEYKFINKYLELFKLISNELKNFSSNIMAPNLEKLEDTLYRYQSTNPNPTDILKEIYGICKSTRRRFINFYIKNKELPRDEERDNRQDNIWWDNQINGLNIRKYNFTETNFDEHNREYYSLKILLTLLKKRVDSHISAIRSKLNKFSHENLCSIGWWARTKLWWNHGFRNVYTLLPFYTRYMGQNLRTLKNDIDNVISELDECHNCNEGMDPENIDSRNAPLLGDLDYLVYLCRKQLNLATEELNNESYLHFSTDINRKKESIVMRLNLPKDEDTPVATAAAEKK